LKNLWTGAPTRLDRKSADDLRLILFLSAADCASCLTILDGIDTLPGRINDSRLTVEVIFVRSSEEEVKIYLNERKKAHAQLYNAYLDEHQDVENDVKLPGRTPVAVLVDGAFNVKVAEGATSSFAAQQDFLNAVVQLSSRSKEGT